MEVKTGTQLDHRLEATFEAKGLTKVRRYLNKSTDRALSLWLRLAPALLDAPADAALWLYISRDKKHPLYREIYFAAVRWWASAGEAPSLSEIASEESIRELDSELAAFLEQQRYLDELEPFLPRTPLPAAPATAPPLEELLGASMSAAKKIFDALEAQNYLLWDRSQREIPEQPWAWLLVHTLPRVTVDAELLTAVRTAIVNPGPTTHQHLRTLRERLTALDPRLADVIHSLVEP